MKKLLIKGGYLFLVLFLAIGVMAAPVLAKDGNASATEETVDLDEYLDKFANEEVEIIEEEEGTFTVRNASSGDIVFTAEVTTDQMYVTAKALNVRTIPTIDSTRYNLIYEGTEVWRIGKSDCGWDIIDINDRQYFVWSEYLSFDRPERPIVLEEFNEEEVNDDEEEITTYSESLYSPSEFQYQGVIYWGGWRWTWYSERVLPGGGLNIPGRWTDDLGYVRDENGYICLASSTLSKGTVVDTPFGSQGKVYDSGCAGDTLDVYVNW